MNRLSGLLLLILPVIFISCTSNETGSSKDVNPEAIYFDYKIWGKEGDEDITIMLQYRFGGENGTTLVLEEPSKVELDGEVIKGDSTVMTGAFYEIQKPLTGFAGKHTLLFTDNNNKQYKEEFSFQPVTLKTTIPDTIQRGYLSFELDGLDRTDYVRVLLTDTLYKSEGINRVDTVTKSRITITPLDLRNVVDGPVQLEFIKEDERPVKKSTNAGGTISFSYGLKREFILKK
jgi:hypothetical protein